MPELMEIPAPTPNDSTGKRLNAVLNAKRCSEIWTARRIVCARIVILLSLPMAYLLLRGQGIDDVGARFVVVLWILALGCLIGCAAAGARADRLVDALLDQAGGRRIKIDE
ncbi:MAG TPA: hypothetical protein VF713_16405 [Thermoanaerobaculia bacterium]